jgi:hypothetical protein
LNNNWIYFFKMVIINEFRDSVKSTNGETNLEKFIELTDYYHSRLNGTRGLDFFLCVLAKLEGKAYYIGKESDPQTWPELKKRLETAFIVKRSLNLLHTLLTNCVQKENESILDFSLKLKKLIKEINLVYKSKNENNTFYETDEPILNAFIEGLQDSNMRILIRSKADTMEEAMELAQEEETRNLNRLTSMRKEQQTCSFCSAPTHNLDFCYLFRKQNERISNNFQKPNNNNFNQGQNQNYRRQNYNSQNYNGNNSRNQNSNYNYSNNQQNQTRNYQNVPQNQNYNYRNYNNQQTQNRNYQYSNQNPNYTYKNYNNQENRNKNFQNYNQNPNYSSQNDNRNQRNNNDQYGQNKRVTLANENMLDSSKNWEDQGNTSALTQVANL